MRAAVALAVLALVAGCFASIDLSRLDGGSDAGTPLADGGPPAGCPAPMIETPGGCVDPTEVTRGAYAAFLAARAGDTSGQATVCRGNSSFTPPSDWPPAGGTENSPIAHVDWCDAAAYCGWRGARLCRRSEWTAACSAAGARAYPYGATFVANACRTGAARPAAVGTSPGCEGGYPGLFDLSGNVEEWQDACEDGQGASGNNDPCVALGGGFDADPAGAACAAAETDRRSSAAAHRGFRCCR